MKTHLWLSVLTAVLLIAYPLSLGPVLRTQVRFNVPLTRSLYTGRLLFPHFYEPLAFLCRWQPFGTAMSWYLDLWVGDYPIENTQIL
jgi:hypothetical protein